jgi:dipeptidyl aminopeptidase/acylaminoacyl peptidase
MVAASPRLRPVILAVDPVSGAAEIIQRSATLQIDPGYISIPRPIKFPTENGLSAYALFYPPLNQDFAAPAEELPPLIVISHGGPTGATVAALSLSIQFWTSRGFGVVDVNYGGSSGFGRAYRQRLNGQWGVVDVQDCINAAKYLIAQGFADPKRVAVRGGSAGGYTTLVGLTMYDFFAAGASHFGLADLVPFVKDTHKFESRYLDRLIGPYPEQAELYRQRSPVNYAHQINCPVILFQGLEDKVVPPSQAEIMVRALEARRIPHAYLAFEGEQHGFRKAETIERVAEAELYFYSRVFGFELAEPVKPVKIVHG